MTPQRPGWVIQQILKGSSFSCCGNEDLYPFKCVSCGRPSVLCFECDTLYPDLSNTGIHANFNWESFRCLTCGTGLRKGFFHDPVHRISFAEWSARGLDHLLEDAAAHELFSMFNSTGEQLADWLARGMLSTMKLRLNEFRTLGEAIAPMAAGAEAFRVRGQEVASGGSRRKTIAWHSALTDPTERAYAMLGIADVLLPGK